MKIRFSKTLMSVFLGMSALVFASCGKAPQGGPTVPTVVITDANHETVTDNGIDFHTNGFGFKQMSSGGSYGVMCAAAKLERVNKVIVEFTQVGCLGSMQAFPSLDNTSFSGETGDIPNYLSVSEVEDNKLVFDFTTAEFVDRFVGGPYYLKMWAWANGPGEGDSIVSSITIEYIPWTAPAE